VQKITLTGSYLNTANELTKGFVLAEKQSLTFSGIYSAAALESTKGALNAEVQSVTITGISSGLVHETIKGYKTISRLPFEEEWSLYHPKTLKRQIFQNNLYAGIN
jgi:hypothetical protein